MLTVFRTDENYMVQRKAYEQCIRDRKLTHIFRPGDREFPGEKSFMPGQVVLLKVVAVPGNAAYSIAPVYVPDIEIPVNILSSRAKRMRQLTIDDFVGAGPWIHDRTSLVHELALVYNLGEEVFQQNYLVTITTFGYFDPAKIRIIES